MIVGLFADVLLPYTVVVEQTQLAELEHADPVVVEAAVKEEEEVSHFEQLFVVEADAVVETKGVVVAAAEAEMARQMVHAEQHDGDDVHLPDDDDPEVEAEAE